MFIGRALEVEAWAEEIDGRKLHLAGKIVDVDSGKVVTEGRALFVEVDLSHFAQGSGKPLEYWNDVDGTIPP